MVLALIALITIKLMVQEKIASNNHALQNKKLKQVVSVLIA